MHANKSLLLARWFLSNLRSLIPFSNRLHFPWFKQLKLRTASQRLSLATQFAIPGLEPPDLVRFWIIPMAPYHMDQTFERNLVLWPLHSLLVSKSADRRDGSIYSIPQPPCMPVIYRWEVPVVAAAVRCRPWTRIHQPDRKWSWVHFR